VNLGLTTIVSETVQDEGEVTEHTLRTLFLINLEPAVGKKPAAQHWPIDLLVGLSL
jgi:hypothetical protein